MNKKFNPDITTGAYGDKNLSDEWYLAACSMLQSTLDPKYLTAVQKYTPQHISIPSWSQVAAIGCIYLTKSNFSNLLNETVWNLQKRTQLIALQQQAKQAIIYLADQLIHQVNAGFNTVMGGRKTDFNWGSNSNCANQGWILMEAYRLTGKVDYRQAAISNLDYLLGRNPTGYCFVTGFGSLSPLHPHHRISISDKVEAPVPGWLVGGPNPGRQDGVKGYPSERADLSYIDNDQAYSVNEVAINWNAPLVYLLAAIEATEPASKN
jgi:endoglucanase